MVGAVVAFGITELVHGLYSPVPSIFVSLAQRIVELTPGEPRDAGHRTPRHGRHTDADRVGAHRHRGRRRSSSATSPSGTLLWPSLGVAVLAAIAVAAALADPFVATVPTVDHHRRRPPRRRRRHRTPAARGGPPGRGRTRRRRPSPAGDAGQRGLARREVEGGRLGRGDRRRTRRLPAARRRRRRGRSRGRWRGTPAGRWNRPERGQTQEAEPAREVAGRETAGREGRGGRGRREGREARDAAATSRRMPPSTCQGCRSSSHRRAASTS